MGAFKLWCWRRPLRVPWTARRSNQSILKEISPGCSLEGLMLSWNSNILATWCEELTHLKRPWCWARLKAGEERDDGWDGWMASPTQWTWLWVNSRCWQLTGKPGVLQPMGLQSQTRLSNWTELNWLYFSTYCTVRSNMFFLFSVFVMYYSCEKYYKRITVQYYIAECVSWVRRLTLLALGTNCIYERALRTELVLM